MKPTSMNDRKRCRALQLQPSVIGHNYFSCILRASRRNADIKTASCLTVVACVMFNFTITSCTKTHEKRYRDARAK